MNDRELLERAARAAGIELGEWMEVGVHNGFAVAYGIRPAGVCRNPLTDDGDALRLAVALLLTAKQSDVLRMVRIELPAVGRVIEERHGADPAAAARRAIVRAAAELCP